jgi:hypothetical protein
MKLLMFSESSSVHHQEFIHCKLSNGTRCVQKVKIHHVKANRENFYAYCGNTAVDLDPLPVNHVHLTVVEPALFE